MVEVSRTQRICKILQRKSIEELRGAKINQWCKNSPAVYAN
jgi:hypothetical protein